MGSSVWRAFTDNPQFFFGAWRVLTYDCDYDVASGKMIEARAYPE
jgi:hypothetical protein